MSEYTYDIDGFDGEVTILDNGHNWRFIEQFVLLKGDTAFVRGLETYQNKVIYQYECKVEENDKKKLVLIKPDGIGRTPLTEKYNLRYYH